METTYSMNSPLCAIIVTYNRKELLYRNIQAILSQKDTLDILIFDNHSSDGTYEYLKEKGLLLSPSIKYHYSHSNLGGAGGFSKGIKIAYEIGYEYYWLMDDDGYCTNEETLHQLLLHIPTDRKDFILNSTVICNKDNLLTFGFLDISTYSELRDQSVNGVYEGYINPFNSTLISRECVEKIGFPKGEFFLYGDEHEYMLRAKKHDVFICTVVDSLYYHPINRKIQYKHFFRFSIPIKDEPVWKTFCDVRNSTYISSQYDSKKMLMVRIFIYINSALKRDDRKIIYLRYTLLGIIDGLRGNFCRPIMFDK